MINCAIDTYLFYLFVNKCACNKFILPCQLHLYVNMNIRYVHRSRTWTARSTISEVNCKYIRITHIHTHTQYLGISTRFRDKENFLQSFEMWNVFISWHILSVSQLFSMKPTLKKVSKYENKFAKLQKKAAEFNFRNQLKQVKKKEFTLEEEDKEVRMIVFNHVLASKTKLFLFSVNFCFCLSSPVLKIQIFGFFFFWICQETRTIFCGQVYFRVTSSIFFTHFSSLSLYFIFFMYLILRFCKFSYWYIRWRFFCVFAKDAHFFFDTQPHDELMCSSVHSRCFI